MKVFDLPTAAAFYQEVLGFEPVAGDLKGGWCMLRLGPATLMLNTAYDQGERPAEPEPARMRGHADTSLYLGAPDLNHVYAQLRGKGWPASKPAQTSYGMRVVSTHDPDGFRVIFISPA